MSTNNSFTLGRVQQAYDIDVKERIAKVEKRANDAIGSFKELVEEIGKLQNESQGTTVKEQVKDIANDMNNSQVMVTRMLAAQLQALHGLVELGPANDSV